MLCQRLMHHVITSSSDDEERNEFLLYILTIYSIFNCVLKFDEVLILHCNQSYENLVFTWIILTNLKL